MKNPENRDIFDQRMIDVQFLLNAIKVSMVQGKNFLINRLMPKGPIMRERHLNYIYKAIWGMFAADVDKTLLFRMLDWVWEKALHANGDFFFSDEKPEYQIFLRIYRPLTFLKVAAWIDHPLVKEELILNRIFQYQHPKSGGVFNYIGEDPKKIEYRDTINVLNTTFFGQLMLALNMKNRAIKAGDWVRSFVEANEKNMLVNGLMYTQVTIDGDLVMDYKPDEKIGYVVDNKDEKQEFWQVGTAMAYLCDLYEILKISWGYSEEQARPYLDCALKLLDFEATMPLYTYLWPSKCKVGWGAGELLRILVKYNLGEIEQIEKVYRICEKVATFTFIDNQLPNGGWSCMHYPLNNGIPELKFSYKPLKGVVNVPDKPIEDSKTIFLLPEDITGEFLGEMRGIQDGLTEYYRKIVSR